MTRDWITNEIFRRVHPNGLTMGEYIKKHFNAKFGVSLVLGADMNDMKNMVDYKI